MQVLSVGEILWDVFPDQEHLGGAPLNFAVNMARLGHRSALLASLGEDERGRRARAAVEKLGVDTRFVRLLPDTPTGVAVVSTGTDNEPRFEIPRPAAFSYLEVGPEHLEQIKASRPEWMYFGTLVQMQPEVESATTGLLNALPETRGFYDMNLRPGCWTLPLVQRLCGLAAVLKLNEFEAQTLGNLTGMGAETFSLEDFCACWAAEYALDTICVTLGPAGCMVYEQGVAHTVPGIPTRVKDTVGAGDACAAGLLHGLHMGWPVLTRARFANALGSIVASREGATPMWTIEECLRLASITA